MKTGILFLLHFQNQDGKSLNLMIQLGFITSVVQDEFLSLMFQSSCILTLFMINYNLLFKCV